MHPNLDRATVNSFGDEWSRFDQTALDADEASAIFRAYFAIFPWSDLPENATGFDMGCGSWRWTRFVSRRVGHLHCIDPSSALDVARGGLADLHNLSFHMVSVSDSPLPANSQDFGCSLGVLHHIPDTAEGLSAWTRMRKPGAPFLVYLYYALDNRSRAFRLVVRLSDWLRRFVCRLSPRPKYLCTAVFA